MKKFHRCVKDFQPFYFFAKKWERPLTFFHSVEMVSFTHQRKTKKVKDTWPCDRKNEWKHENKKK